MIIIPAIDIIEGKCVRLTHGDYNQKSTYEMDPVDVARSFEKDGAGYIHVVDLEGAQFDEPKNLETIKRIIKAVNIPVQFGGGLKHLEAIKKVLDIGVSRIIIGTSALERPELVSSAIQKFGPERIVVGVDANKGNVAVRGWIVVSTKKAIDLIEEMTNLGVERFIYTDIARDGTLSGPNLEELSRVASITDAKIISSGGISGIKDISAIKNLPHPNIEGIIIVKAIYENKIDLKEAVLLSKA